MSATVEGSHGGTATETSASRAGLREWAGLGVLTLPVLLVSMDMTVLHLALPAVTADLRPSSTQVLWIVDVYAFVVAGLLITMGAVGDRIGRRRLLLIGAAGFAATSIAAATATSAGALIAARAGLGVAGATLAPSTLALIRTMFTDPRQRSVATSVWVLSFLAGAAVGPVVGGVLLQSFWWGSVFLLGVPVMAVLLTAGPALLPEYRDPRAGGVDLVSAGMSLAAILSLVYAVKEVAAHGPALAPLLVAGAGVLLGVVFVRRQQRLPDPLIDVHLLRHGSFAIALAVLTLGSVVLAGVGFLTAQHLQLVLGLSPLAAGSWTLPPLAAGIAAIVVTQAAARKVPGAVVTVVGLSVAAAGLVVLTRTPTTGVAVVVTGLAVLFAGLMPVLARGVDAVTSAAPPERAGAAAALSETAQELGGALGIAALGSIATTVYRTRLQDQLEQLSPSAADAASTMAGAVSSSERLPDAVIVSAVDAFTHGLQTAAATSAAVMAAAAVITVVAQRRQLLPASKPTWGV